MGAYEFYEFREREDDEGNVDKVTVVCQDVKRGFSRTVKRVHVLFSVSDDSDVVKFRKIQWRNGNDERRSIHAVGRKRLTRGVALGVVACQRRGYEVSHPFSEDALDAQLGDDDGGES